jgi:hypothetical protein
VGAAVRPRHELVAARIAAATSEASKRLLHRRSAAVLEAGLHPAAGLDMMWAAAEHWRASGDSRRALELALAFGNQLLEIGVPNDVLVMCEGAHALCAAREDHFRVLRLKATALHAVAKFREALSSLLELLSRERGVVSHAEWATDTLAAIEVEARAVGFTDSAAETAAALAADASLEPRLRIAAASLAVRIAANTGNAEIATNAWDSVRDHATADAAHGTESIMLSVMYNLTFGDPQIGAVATRALAFRARELPPQYSTLRVLVVLVDALRACADLDSAARAADAQFAMGVRLGSPYHARRAAVSGAEIALDRGQLEVAQRWYSELASRSSQSAEPESMFEQRHVAARLHLLSGDARGAYALAVATLNEGTRAGSLTPRHRRLILTTVVQAQLAESRERLNDDQLAELLELHAQTEDRLLLESTLQVLDAALRRAGRDHEADEVRARYLARREISVD